MSVRFDACELDAERFELRREGQPVALEPQAFEVLAYLAEHRERIVSRQELLDAVWGTSFITDGALATRIKEVRRAVGDDGRAQSVIRTIHRRGYRFVAETTSSNDGGPAVAPTDARSVARGPHGAEARALPGRAEEQAVLARLFNEADAGSRRVLFVTGEAGIGKSALTQAFVEPLGGSTEMLLGSGECIEHHGAGEPYLPLLQAVTTIARADLNGDASLVLRRLAPTWAREIPWLTQEPEPPEGGVTRERMLRELVDALEGLSQQRTVVLLPEDLHWSDPSTLDVIELAARRGGPARLLLICTVRTPDASSREHAVHSVVGELVARGYASELPLRPLEPDAADSFLDREAAGLREHPGMRDAILARTGGNPLFMTSVLRDWIASGAITQAGDRWRVGERFHELNADIPDTVRTLIDHQLRRLEQVERTVLEGAALAGGITSASVVAPASGLDRDAVELGLATLARDGLFLVRSELVEWPDGDIEDGYDLVHSLYGEVLLDGVPAARRTRMHRQIADYLVERLGPAADSAADEIASHYVLAHDADRAIPALLRAARRAISRAAYPEARIAIESGLSLLPRIGNERERLSCEMRLQSTLGEVLIALEGWGSPTVQNAYERALEICRLVPDPQMMLDVLYGLATAHEFRGRYDSASQFLRERLALQEFGTGMAVIESHELLACSLFHQGAHEEALRHAETGFALHEDSQDLPLAPGTPFGERPEVACRSWSAHALWFLGRVDEALTRARSAVDHARDEPTRMNALSHLAMIQQYRGEPEALIETAAQAVELAQGFGFRSVELMLQLMVSWARSVLGETAALDRLRNEITTYRDTGIRLDFPYYLGIYADAALRLGDLGQAREAVDEAFASMDPDRAYNLEPELLRLHALVGRSEGSDVASTLAELRLAADHASAHSARAIELRALADILETGTVVKTAPEAATLRALLDDMPEGAGTADRTRAERALEAHAAS